jgi:hypothetical protein
MIVGKNPPPPQQPPKDPLVGCPRGCGTSVKLSKSGDPHPATKMVNGEIVYYTCK